MSRHTVRVTPRDAPLIRMYQMRQGQIGIIRDKSADVYDGQAVLGVYGGRCPRIVSLAEGDVWGYQAFADEGFMVELLPPGTTITMTVGGDNG